MRLILYILFDWKGSSREFYGSYAWINGYPWEQVNPFWGYIYETPNEKWSKKKINRFFSSKGKKEHLNDRLLKRGKLVHVQSHMYHVVGLSLIWCVQHIRSMNKRLMTHPEDEPVSHSPSNDYSVSSTNENRIPACKRLIIEYLGKFSEIFDSRKIFNKPSEKEINAVCLFEGGGWILIPIAIKIWYYRTQFRRWGFRGYKEENMDKGEAQFARVKYR